MDTTKMTVILFPASSNHHDATVMFYSFASPSAAAICSLDHKDFNVTSRVALTSLRKKRNLI